MEELRRCSNSESAHSLDQCEFDSQALEEAFANSNAAREGASIPVGGADRQRV